MKTLEASLKDAVHADFKAGGGGNCNFPKLMQNLIHLRKQQ